jgi:hypothetical protein
MKKISILLIAMLFSITLFSQVPTPIPANNTSYCLNEVQVYGDQVIDPLATYSFSITPVFPFTVISSGDQIEVTWNTPGSYTVEITKTIGLCSSVGQAIINVFPPTTPIVTIDALCQGIGTINLTANPLGSNPVFGGVGVSGNTFDAAGLAQGVYPITFTSTDVNGCPMTGNGSITITPPPPTPIIFTN